MKNIKLSIKMWWFENRGKILAIPALLVFVFLFSFTSFDTKIEMKEAVVQSHQYVGTEFGDVKKLYVTIEDGSIAYVTNPRGKIISPGTQICLFKKSRLLGNVSYKFKHAGKCL